MAIRALNFHALTMDLQLGALVLANGPSQPLSFLLGLGYMARPFAAIPFNLPSVLMRHHSVSIPFWHDRSLPWVA